MLIKKTCPFCQGTGIRMVQTSSMFGLLRKEIPTTCEECNGNGHVVELPSCPFCEGQGLVGNEREICRTCNGTGRVDAFGFIPRELLRPGTLFARRCDQCSEGTFEIVSNIEEHKMTRSWEREEELRQIEVVERVKVRCSSCGHSYHIPVSPEWHGKLTPEITGNLENMGVNLSFFYENR
jgi:DnaJ-class molecular chaperone